MWITTSAALLLGSFSALTLPSGAQQEAPAAPRAPDTPQQLRAKFLALEDEFDEGQQAFYAEMQAKWEAHEASGASDEEMEFPDPFEAAYFPRFLALGDAGSVDANAWCLSYYRFSEETGADARADKTQRLLAVLAGSPSEEVVQSLCGFLGREAFPSPWGGPDDPEARLGSEAAFAFLDVIHATAESEDVKATALYTRGSALKDSVMMSDSDDEAAKAVRAEAEIVLEKVATLYPTTKVGERCVGMLFAERSLNVGQVAPDIVGKDHDGNDIRRSDFAGKVTVLDFWGFW